MRPDWSDRALCAAMESNDFYPEDIEGLSPEEVVAAEEAAKTICGRCPVRAECLAVALEREQSLTPEEIAASQRRKRPKPLELHRWGVWGGLNPREREDLMAAAAAVVA